MTVPVEAAPPPALGPYRIVGILGEGGMGVVYLGEQTEPIPRRVAVKLVRPGLDSREVLARFAREQRAMASLDHPGIARILDAGIAGDGRPWFAMEHVPGSPITEFCDRERLDLEARLRLLVRTCRAVHHAHEQGIVHRDLKPRNVLVRTVDGEAEPKVIDFGIAKAADPRPFAAATIHTELGRILGTPAYMSPEQADPRREVDRRADVFSLGTIAYEVLVGSPPLDAGQLESRSFVEVQRMIAEDTLPTPSTRLAGTGAEQVSWLRRTSPRELRRRLREGLDDVVGKATEKRRELRYATAAELADNLERCLSGGVPRARPRGPGGRLLRAVRRHRRRAAAWSAAALGAALIAALAWLWLDAAAERDALLRELERLGREADARLVLDELPREAGVLRATDVLARPAAVPDARTVHGVSVLGRRAELAVRVHGPAAEPAIEACADHAAALIVFGQAERAARVLAATLAAIDARGGASRRAVARLRADLATALRAQGETEGALRELAAAESAGRDVEPALLRVVARNRACAAETLARPGPERR